MEILSDGLGYAVSFGGTAWATIVLMTVIIMLGVVVSVSMPFRTRWRISVAFLWKTEILEGVMNPMRRWWDQQKDKEPAGDQREAWFLFKASLFHGSKTLYQRSCRKAIFDFTPWLDWEPTLNARDATPLPIPR
jgi:hypothetical protein